MRTINLKRETRMSMTVGLAAALSASCGGFSFPDPPPPPPDQTVTCTCTCDDACTPSQVVVAIAADGSERAACTVQDADFGTFTTTTPVGSQTCVAQDASPPAIDQACEARCGLVRTQEVISPFTGRRLVVAGTPVLPVIGATRLCRHSGNEGFTLANSCTAGSFSALTAIADPRETTTVQMNSQASVAELNLPGGEFGGREIVPVPSPAGMVVFYGGNCPGRTCPIYMAQVQLQSPGFSVQGSSIAATTIVNQSTIEGVKAANSQVTFPASALDLLAVTAIGDRPVAVELSPTSPVTGSYDAVQGELRLSATFSNGSGFSQQLISFSLQGQAIARPPVANAGPDQSAMCSTAGPEVVAVDGSASFDPDHDPLTFEWSENGVVFARTPVATITLGPGAHDLVVTATDSTGRSAQDVVRIVVSDSAPPFFTFVPPAVFVESPGPVALGQARAQDGCGRATVTNNAPSSFPIGRTLVTWTAVDDSGNRATAVQEVWVLPSSASSCPAGTKIILGTSNNDMLVGTKGADCIIGFGGQDRIDGRGGNDVLLGGEGDDVLVGGEGDDILAGGSGQDRISGDGGDDRLAGNSGDDVLSGGNGNDILVGGDGQDRVSGDGGDDVLSGTAGDDNLQGGPGVDRCIADQDHDVVGTCE